MSKDQSDPRRTDMLQDDIPELRGKSPDELRFWRLIESREPDGDYNENIALACGHLIFTVGQPPELQYMFCAQCLHDWLEAERKARVESTS
jgi:hypothetical protein